MSKQTNPVRALLCRIIEYCRSIGHLIESLAMAPPTPGRTGQAFCLYCDSGTYPLIPLALL